MKKSKLLLVLFLVMFFVGVSSVSAVDVQGCAGISSELKIDVKIVNTISLIITVIEIAVPVILVIFGMMDLMKGVMAQKDDEIKKGQQTLIKRIVAAVLVFFVIAIVKMVFSFAADDQGGNMMNCVNCFLNGADKATGVCKTN